MVYKLFSLEDDFLSTAANQEQLSTASDVVREGPVRAMETVFQLPQSNLTLGSADLVSFWQNLG